MKLYNRKQAARYLRRSVEGIRLLERGGHLKPVPTPDGNVRFTQNELDNFEPPKTGRPSGVTKKLAVYVETQPRNTKLTTARLSKIVGAKRLTIIRALHRLATAGLVKHNGSRGASSWWKVL